MATGCSSLRDTKPFSALALVRFIALTTFRKTGAGVIAPVWFAPHAGTDYVEIGPSAGKVKRIRFTPRVTLAT